MPNESKNMAFLTGNYFRNCHCLLGKIVFFFIDKKKETKYLFYLRDKIMIFTVSKIQ